MKNKIKIQPIGGRIIKSSVAVAVCIIIFYFRTLLPIGNGIPFYGALAALWCVQPYSEASKNNAGQRTFGTFTGAVFGLGFIIFLRAVNLRMQIPVYLLASLLIIPVIYVTIILNKRNAAFFSCVVFLSIALTHSFDDDPYLFVFNRVLDTLIGIGVGLSVNSFRLPHKYDKETLYVSGIDSVLIPDDHSSIKNTLVELNRLIESGVRFTISTIHSPAEVILRMNGVRFNYPIIVMDGAAMYDIDKKEYIETEYLQPELSEAAERIIAENDMHCFVNVMYDTTLLIFYSDISEGPESMFFEKYRHSAYRNYIKDSFRHHDECEKVLYLMVLDTEDRIMDLFEKLNNELYGRIRITVTDSEYSGYKFLKVFSLSASKHEMIKKLKKHTGIEHVLTFGSIEGEYDIYIDDGGGNSTIKKIKKLYQRGL